MLISEARRFNPQGKQSVNVLVRERRYRFENAGSAREELMQSVPAFVHDGHHIAKAAGIIDQNVRKKLRRRVAAETAARTFQVLEPISDVLRDLHELPLISRACCGR